MTEDLLARLKEIDMAILSDVVQKDQSSPNFEISKWSVKLLSSKGVINPDGLWLFSGEGSDREGSRLWSVVLKIIERPEQEPPLSDLWNWKRVFLLAQSGLTEHMPGPVKAPHFYRVDETPDYGWLWMEHVISQRASPWKLNDYSFAARQLGTWNGRFIKEMPPLTEPWLARQHLRSWLSDSDPERDWQFTLNQKHISDNTRIRIERLWGEREKFYSVLETLPQDFSQFDSQRRNLFIRTRVDDQDELVLVDWAMCGLGPLGAELCFLVGMSSVFFEWPPSALPELDKAAFESYLQGLHEAGWTGEADRVRLGYLAWLAMWWGACFPSMTAWWCSADNRPSASKALGLAEEELFLQWLPILDYSLDCADEARLLMSKLGFI